MNGDFTRGWAAFGRRIVGAMRLNGATYREISGAPDALAQAVAVILLSSLASAIVFLLTGRSPGLTVDVDWSSYPVTRESDTAAALAGGILDGGWGLIVWAAQVTIIWLLWNRFASHRHGWRAIATPLGFANAPLIVFAFLEAVPAAGSVLGGIGLVWTLVASIVAARAALATGWGKAIALLMISIALILLLSIAALRAVRF